MDFPNGMQDKGRDRPAKIFLFSVNPCSGHAFIILEDIYQEGMKKLSPARAEFMIFPDNSEEKRGECHGEQKKEEVSASILRSFGFGRIFMV
jgi:hypothetical protein